MKGVDEVKCNILKGQIETTEGCGETMPISPMWMCTDHLEWDGQTLHIAGADDCICAVWFNNADPLELTEKFDRSLDTWNKVLAQMEADERFFTPPTPEEVEQAVRATLSLVNEMESKA